MSKDAFRQAGQEGAPASAAVKYTLRTRLRAPEETVEIRPRVPGQIITPDMLATLDDEDTPCVRVWVKDRDSVTFDFPPFPTDFPVGYVPSELRRAEWEALFPDGPSFDEIGGEDWVEITYSYDPDPEKEGHFPYEILSARYKPGAECANVVPFNRSP